MYQVIVGNIGTVYCGQDEDKAIRTHNDYVELSKIGYGRAAGENVTTFRDYEPWLEYIGTLEDGQ